MVIDGLMELVGGLHREAVDLLIGPELMLRIVGSLCVGGEVTNGTLDS